jgi:hypothetical protein
MTPDQVLCEYCDKPMTPDEIASCTGGPAVCDSCWDGEEEQRGQLPEDDYRQDR